MSLFNKQENKIDFYDAEVKPNLRARDGLKHVLALSLNLPLVNPQIPLVQNHFTDALDNVLRRMQADGYDIIDVKFQEAALFGKTHNDQFFTLIIYK